PSQGLYLTDGTGGLYAETQDDQQQIREGDEVQVIGFPAAGNFSPVLKSANLRRTGNHVQPTITPVTGQEASKGKFDVQLITITGTLNSILQHLNQRRLLVESDDHINFEAVFSPADKWPATLQEGS